jgi:hypothetical protein
MDREKSDRTITAPVDSSYDEKSQCKEFSTFNLTIIFTGLLDLAEQVAAGISA